jgi:hypothetical protein
MRTTVGILAVVIALGGAGIVAADERAEWGIAVSVGAESGSQALLVENDSGFHLVAVDPFASIQRAGRAWMTFSDIRPGDRVDYAVSPFAGMDVADVLHVTPMRHADARR